MNKPHKWAEVIKAAADGKDIQFRKTIDEEWEDKSGSDALRTNTWQEYHDYRIKPKPEYPVTSMSCSDLCEAYKDNDSKNDPSWNSEAARNLANAAIRRAIQDGAVILPNKE